MSAASEKGIAIISGHHRSNQFVPWPNQNIHTHNAQPPSAVRAQTMIHTIRLRRLGTVVRIRRPGRVRCDRAIVRSARILTGHAIGGAA
ncbi:hypothetical protein GCM10009806_01610 [Microbacterium flavum]